ncbi:MAG TPA: CpsB/CapC family capsule biosynthesis tyrosine phosphatase [Gemmatimonadales bacterium]|nr:CpsB/CapC family capsule biosynthesis tyrosine phosphatase [Gemmatimonadales bacterium]
MIDLHSHLLPAVDDGSRSVAQSVGVLREVARLGVTDICLTPHLTASRAEAGVPPAHDAAFEALRTQAPPEIRLHRGAEVMLDRPLGPGAAANRGITLGASRYILVEFPRIVPAETVRMALRQVLSVGLVPVLAHPERYSSCSVAAAQAWRATGARMQVDANTLLSGTARGDRARRLIAAGLADILASDNHGDERSLGAVREALIEHDAESAAEILLVRNPRAILDDRELDEAGAVPLRNTWAQRLRRLLEGEG